MTSRTLQADPVACPGLFRPALSANGQLLRVRLRSGMLNAIQARAVADLADFAESTLLVTHRANLQLRSFAKVAPQVLQHFQAIGLAGSVAAVDHLRNIMSSPTAGIDPEALIDTGPIVGALDDYISTHPYLAGLSAKFSIGVDGGEEISVRNRPNDIWFVAEQTTDPSMKFRLYFGLGSGREVDTNLLFLPHQCVPAVAAIAQVYLDHAHRLSPIVDSHRRSNKPRWRDLIGAWGIEWCLDQIRHCAQIEADPEPGRRPHQPAPSTQPVGAHSQRQLGYSWVGIVLPLGHLRSGQLRQLAQLCEKYGSAHLRLTPWQNLLIPDIPTASVEKVRAELARLGWSDDRHHPGSGVVACAGRPSCKAAEVDAQAQARELIGRLDCAVNIHVSGCAKGCAQPFASDIALLGTAPEAYEIYLRDGQAVFGRRLWEAAPAADALLKVERLVELYLHRRRDAAESFSAWTTRQSVDTLRTLHTHV